MGGRELGGMVELCEKGGKIECGGEVVKKMRGGEVKGEEGSVEVRMGGIGKDLECRGDRGEMMGRIEGEGYGLWGDVED